MFKRIHLFALSLLGALLLDLATKRWIMAILPDGTYYPEDAIEVIPGWLYWVHVHNTGAAWGMLSGFTWLLALLAIAVVSLLFFFRHHFNWESRLCQLALGLLVGGILGNLTDRILYGHVVDFIDVHLPFYRWPAFNIADSAIFLGAVLYLLSPKKA